MLRIRKIDIKNFAKIKNFSLEMPAYYSFSQENEFGKTSLIEALICLFYGVQESMFAKEKRNRERFLPWSGGKIELTASFDLDGRQYFLSRKIGRTKSSDSLYLFDETEGKEIVLENKQEPGTRLFHFSRQEFESLCYISHGGSSLEVSNIKNTAKQDIIEALRNISQGMNQTVSLAKSRELLLQKQKKIKNYNFAKGLLSELQAEKSKLEAELFQEKRSENLRMEYCKCLEDLDYQDEQLQKYYSLHFSVKEKSKLIYDLVLQIKQTLGNEEIIYFNKKLATVKQDLQLMREKIELYLTRLTQEEEKQKKRQALFNENQQKLENLQIGKQALDKEIKKAEADLQEAEEKVVHGKNEHESLVQLRFKYQYCYLLSFSLFCLFLSASFGLKLWQHSLSALWSVFGIGLSLSCAAVFIFTYIRWQKLKDKEKNDKILRSDQEHRLKVLQNNLAALTKLIIDNREKSAGLIKQNEFLSEEEKQVHKLTKKFNQEIRDLQEEKQGLENEMENLNSKLTELQKSGLRAWTDLYRRLCLEQENLEQAYQEAEKFRHQSLTFVDENLLSLLRQEDIYEKFSLFEELKLLNYEPDLVEKFKDELDKFSLLSLPSFELKKQDFRFIKSSYLDNWGEFLHRANSNLQLQRQEYKFYLQTLSFSAYSIYELEKLIEEKSENIAKAEFEYEAYTLALEILDRALNELNQNFTPKLRAICESYLSKLSLNKYSKVVSDKDLNLSVFDEEYQEYKKAESLSKGTLEQLYFALRLSLLDLLDEKCYLPLLLDDPFVHYDGKRKEAALKVLGDVAQKRQLVLMQVA